jgi:hypothetical protein
VLFIWCGSSVGDDVLQATSYIFVHISVFLNDQVFKE